MPVTKNDCCTRDVRVLSDCIVDDQGVCDVDGLCFMCHALEYAMLLVTCQALFAQIL